ncbi:thioredoxin family protein [Planctomycetota bacterium]|nr:thioredoxin family protein [Planctomycetota bacterium]
MLRYLAPALLVLSSVACAQEVQPTAGIAWRATWDDALAAAQRTQRPILLVAAAPHCHNISGMW